MEDLQLSIIIVNYRSEQYLKKCLASLYNNLKGIRFEIIVVNNDKKEDLAGIKNKFSEINLINHRKNIGFGAAHNSGSKQARGKILLILNPDIEILSAGLVKILDKFEQDEKIAAIGPRLIMADGKTQPWCAGKEASVARNIKNKLGSVESKKIWESEEEILADWVSGAAMFVRKEIFAFVGGFDEKFFMYFEDEDLCGRIRGMGYKVVYYPQVSVLHDGGKSRKSLLKQKMQYYKSLFYYIKKRNAKNV